MQRIASLGILVLVVAPVWAFPPYRSTDADTAAAGILELRLGLARIQRQDSSSSRSTPLTRMNLGIGERSEIIAEFEHSADEHHLEEGAVGFKWARLEDGVGMGVETLLLLPVQSHQSGSGIESQFVATLQRQHWQLHVNVGGFYDPRGQDTERGLRGSLLAEFPRGSARPGLELFVKDTREQKPRVQAGAGIIKQYRLFELRTGIHFGLSENAPDVEASLWLAWRWQVSSGE